jgi:hypothetical protein
MRQRKLYNHLIQGNIFGIKEKIKKFVKNKRMTKANNNK